MVTYAGLAIITDLISGLGGTVAKYLSWGTGAGTAARTDTVLFTEDYSTTNNGSGAQRVTSTVTRTTTSETNDTAQFVGTLTEAHAGGATVTNTGLFDTIGTSGSTTTPPSGGNLLLKSDFTGIALNLNDAIQFTLSLQFT